jgi:hypothetical protein
LSAEGASCYKRRGVSANKGSNVKLAVWNCQGALHEDEKWQALTALRADIAVLPECADPKRPEMKKLVEATRCRTWFGSDETMGLGVVSFGRYEFTPLPRTPDEHADILAVKVVAPCAEFILMGVWTRKQPRKYVENLHDVLDRHESLLRSHDVVLAGDFNSNTIWDKKHGRRSHSRLVERLDALGLVSAYHSSRREAHGSEKEMTFYMRRNINQPYHIDYVFLPRAWLPRLRTCSVGEAATWLRVSDHSALVVEVDDVSAMRHACG